MYRILNNYTHLQDGTAVMFFDGIATKTSQNYVYQFQQDMIIFNNSSDFLMMLTVNGTSYPIKAGGSATFVNVTDFTVYTTVPFSNQFFTVESRVDSIDIIGSGGGGNARGMFVDVRDYGAKGDGIKDDTTALQNALNACGGNRRLFIPSGVYRTTATLYTDNCRGIFGEVPFSGDEGGVMINFDPPTALPDLTPVIEIRDNAYGGALFENFSVTGKANYDRAQLGTIINKTYFDQDKYEMFPSGYVGIRINNNAKPTFRNIATGSLKVGILLDSTDGHITFYDSNLSGLLGVYCRKNSGDYFFQGCGINGIFAGVLLGTTEWVGHWGGMELTMNRVHMGFGPYGFYQCIDSTDYNSIGYSLGIYGDLKTVRFEAIGECAIRMLSKSITNGLHISGFGFSWASNSMLPEMMLPTSLKTDRQQYGAVFGYLGNASIESWDGTLGKSGLSSALGSAYIDTLLSDVVMPGLGEDVKVREIAEHIPVINSFESLEKEMASAKEISGGNLLRNPENVSSWDIQNGTIAVDSAPPAPSADMKQMLGDDITVLKITPSAGGYPYLSQSFPPLLTDSVPVFSYWIYSTVAFSSRARLEYDGWEYIYDGSTAVPANTWTRVVSIGVGQAATNILRAFAIFDMPSTGNTYIAGVMLNYGAFKPYSPTWYPSARDAIGTDEGIILKDRTTGDKSMLLMDGGLLLGSYSDTDGLGATTPIGGGSSGGGGADPATVEARPFNGGNLLWNPEYIGSWENVNNATIAIDNAGMPAMTAEMRHYLGADYKGFLKVTPTTPAGPNPFIQMSFPPLVTDSVPFFSFWVYTTNAALVHGRMEYAGFNYMRDTLINIPAGVWTRFVAEGSATSPNNNLHAFQINNMDPNGVTWIAGVMMNYGEVPRSYSPVRHPFSRKMVEAQQGIVMVDATTGQRVRVYWNNGAWASEPWDNTKDANVW